MKRSLLLALLALPIHQPLATASPLDDLTTNHRVLVVFFANCENREAFERTWASATPASKERDLVIVRADTPLREALNISESDNLAVLVGKDGTEKARWEKVPAPDEVFALIDAMPMRKAEAAGK